jgi:hypothetical protein
MDSVLRNHSLTLALGRSNREGFMRLTLCGGVGVRTSGDLGWLGSARVAHHV